jgi:hypothetical protein
MKRIITLVTLLFLLAAGHVSAMGSCALGGVENIRLLPEGAIERVYITLTCTSDASGVSAYSIVPDTFRVRGWYLYSVTTDPSGVSVPTDQYDVTLVTAGEDIAGGLLANRSSTLTQTVAIPPPTLFWHMVDGTIVVTFANITANPGIVVMTLRFTRN